MTTQTWTGGTGSWSDPGNWSGGSVPGRGDRAIDQNGTIVATETRIVSTVQLDSSQSGSVELSLVSSILDPHGQVLLTDGSNGGPVLDLHNALLEGAVLDTSGSAHLTIDTGSLGLNAGYVSVDGATLMVQNQGVFANLGLMHVENGSMEFMFGSVGSTVSSTDNFGLIDAGAGGTVLLQQTGQNGPMVNAGQITASGGEVAVQALVQQLPSGKITVTNNGSLFLAGNVDGGTIQLQSGMLGYSPAGTAPGEPGATGFNSTLAFTGTTADLRFYVPSSIQETFDSTTNILAVTNASGSTVADIQLANNRVYSAANFHVSGHSDIIYTASQS